MVAGVSESGESCITIHVGGDSLRGGLHRVIQDDVHLYQIVSLYGIDMIIEYRLLWPHQGGSDAERCRVQEVWTRTFD